MHFELSHKEPAIIAKHVVRIIQTTKAKIALALGAIFEKSNICPNTPPVFMPLCIMIVMQPYPYQPYDQPRGQFLSKG